MAQDNRVELRGKHLTFICHLLDLTPDVGPHRVKLPDLIVSHEPLLVQPQPPAIESVWIPIWNLLLFLLILVNKFDFARLQTAQHINIFLVTISLSRQDLFELWLRDNLRLVLTLWKLSYLTPKVLLLNSVILNKPAQHVPNYNVLFVLTKIFSKIYDLARIPTNRALIIFERPTVSLVIPYEVLEGHLAQLGCHNEWVLDERLRFSWAFLHYHWRHYYLILSLRIKFAINKI